MYSRYVKSQESRLSFDDVSSIEILYGLTISASDVGLKSFLTLVLETSGDPIGGPEARGSPQPPALHSCTE